VPIISCISRSKSRTSVLETPSPVEEKLLRNGDAGSNGYLESTVSSSNSSKLTRQDTIPKYIAPVPCNYGLLFMCGSNTALKYIAIVSLAKAICQSCASRHTGAGLLLTDRFSFQLAAEVVYKYLLCSTDAPRYKQPMHTCSCAPIYWQL